MNNLKPSIIVILLLAMIACEQQADLSKSSEYSKNGISFSLPGNWQVTEDVAEDDFRYLFIETPGDAVMFVTTYLKEDALSLFEYSEWFIETSVNDFPIGSRNKGTVLKTRKIIDDQIYDGYKNEFVVSVAGIEVPHAAEFFRFETNAKTAFVSSQVAIEDSSMVEPGFEHVLATFKLQ